MKADSAGYEPQDRVWLWWLADPSTPTLIGELNLIRQAQGVSLRYADAWIDRGFALSDDLPLLRGQEFMPGLPKTAAGAVDDARPDRWGERVIQFLDKPPRLSLLEYLYFAGDQRFGALGVSTSMSAYLPRRWGPLPSLKDVEEMAELVRKVLANEPIAPEFARLISPGATMGGARPKALLEIDSEPWVVKFADGDAIDTPLVEHACMTLATKAGIRVATTRPIRLTHGHAVAVKRFDRSKQARLHAISANVALRAAAQPFGYPELAQLLRRRGVAAKRAYVDQMKELFRRMVFNILMDNTDDHEKNHALLMTDAQEYVLSPAYDVLPSAQGLGFQQMRVGTDAADSTTSNALSMCRQFALSPTEAGDQIKGVAKIVATWKIHFKAAGVSAGDLEQLSSYIDRPFLIEQRGIK